MMRLRKLLLQHLYYNHMQCLHSLVCGSLKIILFCPLVKASLRLGHCVVRCCTVRSLSLQQIEVLELLDLDVASV
jgi:hypothetical protein